MLDEIRSQGATAARVGLTIWDSPFLRAEAMPAHTGEPIWEWSAKVLAWEEGWNQAVAARAEAGSERKAAWICALHRERPALRPKLDLFHPAAGPGENDSLATNTARQPSRAARGR